MQKNKLYLMNINKYTPILYQTVITVIHEGRIYLNNDLYNFIDNYHNCIENKIKNNYSDKLYIADTKLEKHTFIQTEFVGPRLVEDKIKHILSINEIIYQKFKKLYIDYTSNNIATKKDIIRYIYENESKFY